MHGTSWSRLVVLLAGTVLAVVPTGCGKANIRPAETAPAGHGPDPARPGGAPSIGPLPDASTNVSGPLPPTGSGGGCADAGSRCAQNRCGDRGVAGREQCDDGNASAGDGCSPDCKLEGGWACPPGAVCRAAQCGDGQKVGSEQCDDGNGNSGDGCSASCLVESPGPTEADGWLCPTPGQACQRTKCGNGMSEGSEQCDDGNHDLGDGCSPYCRREPECPAAGGACRTACGDGLLLPSDMAAGQACDDGNTVSGDGCAADCKLEQGFACAEVKIEQDPLRLPVVYRDFKGFDQPGGHPDFQRFIGAGEPGIAAATLDMQGKPAHVMGTRRLTVNGDPGFTDKDYFALWWRDDPAYNQTFTEQLTFTRAGAGTNYQFGATPFFPLENRGFGTYMGTAYAGGGFRNFHFTSEVRHWFEYRGNERLDFTGDDDVFVFINKRLAVDLGGVHMAVTGRVTLDATTGAGRVCDLLSPCAITERTVDLGLVVGSVYEMVVFQAERRTDQSNYRLSLANFTGSRTSCHSVCGDGIVTPDEACDLGKDRNTGAYGTCKADCTLTPRCGDGILNGPEDCDGGPTCNSTCRLLTVD
jgi:fibro-slime domain-containing protein